MPSITITDDTYQKLEELKKKILEEEGIELSYNKIIQKLIHYYQKH